MFCTIKSFESLINILGGDDKLGEHFSPKFLDSKHRDVLRIYVIVKQKMRSMSI